MYFITARCWNRFPAFVSEEAKAVFWDRFEWYAREAQFTPWVTSIVANHYHTLGYCKKCRLAYRYTLTQSVRHGLCRDWREYNHTRVKVELEVGLRRALELQAFLEGVPYKRYQKKVEG